MAYQATNNTRNTGFGSLYSDICQFAADISRERNSAMLRGQANTARQRQSHRQELHDAREYAAAQTLNSLKRSGNKVRRSHYLHQLGLISPLKAKVTLTLGSNSSDSPSLASSEIGSSVSGDEANRSALTTIALEGPPASEDDLPMLVDSPPEARFSSLFISFVPGYRAYRPSNHFTGP